MAYEHKIYIVEKTNSFDPKTGKFWGMIVAVFNLSCATGVSGFFDQLPESDVFITEGDTDILEDMYGQPLTEVSVEQLLYVLTLAERKHRSQGYPGLSVQLSMLMSALRTIGAIYDDKHDFVCLHYGY